MSMDVSQAGHIIARIYDAALSPDNWGGVLDDVAHAVGAIGATIFHAEPGYKEVQETRSGMYHNSLFRSEDIDTYITNYAALDRVDLILARPQLSIMHLEEILDRDPSFVKSPVHRWLKDRFNIWHRTGARLNDNETWLAAILIQFDAAREGMRPEETAVFVHILPHIAKALEVNRPVRLLEARFRAILEALDRITIGVGIVTAAGQIVVANRSLERLINDGNGLRRGIKNGRLKAIDATADAALLQALRTAAATAAGEADCAEAWLLIPRANANDILIEICPLRDDTQGLGRLFEGALVYCIDPDVSCDISTAGLQQLFGFSAAENAVAAGVIEGLSNTQIASRRDVSPETIKTQVANVFAKAGVANRYEFLRLALRVDLPVESAEESKR